MKLNTVIAALALCLLGWGVKAQEITVGSYNIRFDNKGDTGNLWVDRGPVVAELIRFHDFDVLGIQEGLKNQLDDLSKALPEYARYGKGRNDGKEAGEHSVIYYRKDRFKLINSGDFWLSETLDKPGLGWDATCCNRICSWIYLQEVKTNKKFYVFNVHFDHQGVVARKESGTLMVKQIRKIAGSEPVLLTGDFNGDRNSEWYKTIAQSEVVADVHGMVKHPYANNSSMNGFRIPRNNAVIDHIFMSRHFTALKWGILTDTYFGKYPSDHFPILAKVTLK